MYHSALHEPGSYPPARQYEDVRRGRIALWHDVVLGLPLPMHAVDAIYTELPWKDGYEEFARRADQAVGRWSEPGRLTYEQWCYRLSVTLIRWGKPYVVVAGRAALRHMAAEWVTPCDLNGSTAVAFGSGLPGIREKTAEMVLERMAARFSSLGDPCCGYGRTARVASSYGRPWVVSDVNPRCIGYIKHAAPGWDK